MRAGDCLAAVWRTVRAGDCLAAVWRTVRAGDVWLLYGGL